MNSWHHTLRLVMVFGIASALTGGAEAQKGKVFESWYMKATEMTADGRLTFLEQPWWPRAKELKEGEKFTLDLNRDGRPDTIVTRLKGNIVEAIDDSGHAAEIWNQVDTAYVVSYGGTGVVDRMVVYTDTRHTGKASEMEIRYYKDGFLRYAWFGENYDDDGAQIFHLTNWQYDSMQFVSKFRGNVLIYINKYDPVTKTWLPLSECPFAFYDPNHDGLGEVVVRAAVQPKEQAVRSDLDHANSYSPMWQAEVQPLTDMVIGNMRLSYNIDAEPRHSNLEKPHYNFGFTMVGQQPYSFPQMRYTDRLRRPPQMVTRLSWREVADDALHYPAEKTGFSWDEAHEVGRWEGEFWIYERRILANTGGPTYRWNIRREYLGTPSTERKLYYSDVDKRYHLFGASEMWMEVGHLVGDKKDLEIRAYDSNGDGYLDTWEIFEPGNPAPVRVTRVISPHADRVLLDRKAMMHAYNDRILPKAIAEDEELIAQMKKLVTSELAAKYEAAANASSEPERRRYCLDVARELYFLKTRDHLYELNAAGKYPLLQTPAPTGTPPDKAKRDQYTVADTQAYWKLATTIEKFVDSYGEGDFHSATALLRAMPTD